MLTSPATTGQNSYLSSPHAKFSGTHGQVTDPALYASRFTTAVDYFACDNPTYTTVTTCTTAGANWILDHTINHNSSCAKCHDVHIGGVDPDVLDQTNSLQNIKSDARCGVSCHSDKSLAISITLPA